MFPQSVKAIYVCSDPISVDPTCPQLSVALEAESSISSEAPRRLKLQKRKREIYSAVHYEYVAVAKKTFVLREAMLLLLKFEVFEVRIVKFCKQRYNCASQNMRTFVEAMSKEMCFYGYLFVMHYNGTSVMAKQQNGKWPKRTGRPS